MVQDMIEVIRLQLITNMKLRAWFCLMPKSVTFYDQYTLHFTNCAFDNAWTCNVCRENVVQRI